MLSLMICHSCCDGVDELIILSFSAAAAAAAAAAAGTVEVCDGG